MSTKTNPKVLSLDVKSPTSGQSLTDSRSAPKRAKRKEMEGQRCQTSEWSHIKMKREIEVYNEIKTKKN